MSWREVLSYWTAVEYLEPQRPELEKAKPEEEWRQGLDWERWAEAAVRQWLRENEMEAGRFEDRYEVRFRIWLGLFDVSSVVEEIEQRLGRDETDEEARWPSSGKTCMAVLWADRSGSPIPGSFGVASLRWAMGRVAAGALGELTGFERWERDLVEWFDLWARGRAGASLSDADFYRILDEIIKRAAWKPRGRMEVARIEPQVVRRDKATDAETSTDLLNSFVVGDLRRVVSALEKGAAGQGIRRYLADDIVADRVDVVRNVQEQRAAMLPEKIPLGCWPSGEAKRLVFGQQLSVNLLMNEKPPVFSVNGLPGTGKTTLLRDIIAAIVVERAQRLVEYEDSRSAFQEHGSNRRGNAKDRTWPAWTVAEDISGWEIVVAAATNNAAENISGEIGAEDEIGREWLAEADYFRDLASAMLGRPAWGLAAAVLGKQENRSKFVSTFWFGGPGKKDRAEEPPARSMQAILKAAEESASAVGANWAAARQEFLRCWQEADALRKRYSSWSKAVEDAPALERKLTACEAAVRETEAKVEGAERQRVQAQADLATVAERRRLAEGRLRSAQRWQEWVRVLLRPRELSRKIEEYRAAKRELDEAERALGAATARVWETEQAAGAAKSSLARRQEELRKVLAEKARVEASVKDARLALGDRFPGEELWNPDRDRERQLSSPWLTDEFNRLRSRLFLSALRVHRAFVEAAAKPVRQNLSLLVDLLDGKDVSVDRRMIPHLWRTLFLVVPVVSTTFASVGRLFKDLDREALGWALIDEAGQARPQDPVGLVWRTKHSVFVGDPMQLEPVVTLPAPASQALREAFGVAEEWDVTGTSAQVLADRANRWGTRMGDAWVGSPLRVHRRCLDPMFTVANRIAYDELMVQATPARPEPPLGPSRWIAVPSYGNEGHWVPAQGEQMLELLAAWVERTGSLPELFVISPFRMVAGKARQLIEREWRRWAGVAGRKKARDWADKYVGTIHVSQGREAEAVILLLGGDPKKPGAFQWAVRTPNLLNVAVTRAKSAIYVIGDPVRWKNLPYSNVLWEELSGRSPRAEDWGAT